MGIWDSEKGLSITKNYEQVMKEVASNLLNKTLVITTILVSIANS